VCLLTCSADVCLLTWSCFCSLLLVMSQQQGVDAPFLRDVAERLRDVDRDIRWMSCHTLAARLSCRSSPSQSSSLLSEELERQLVELVGKALKDRSPYVSQKAQSLLSPLLLWIRPKAIAEIIQILVNLIISEVSQPLSRTLTHSLTMTTRNTNLAPGLAGLDLSFIFADAHFDRERSRNERWACWASVFSFLISRLNAMRFSTLRLSLLSSHFCTWRRRGRGSWRCWESFASSWVRTATSSLPTSSSSSKHSLALSSLPPRDMKRGRRR
jgi:hypothetical protein